MNNIYITLQRIIMGVFITLMVIFNYNTSYAITANNHVDIGTSKELAYDYVAKYTNEDHIILLIGFGKKQIDMEFTIKQLYLPYLKQNLVGLLNQRVMD